MTDASLTLEKAFEYIVLHRAREAAALLAPLIGDPDPFVAYTAHFRLAQALIDLGEIEEAVAVARAGIALSSQHWQAYLVAGFAEKQRGNVDEARILLEEAVRLAPDEPICLMRLSELYSSTGRHEEALERAQHALELAPDSASTHSTLGYALRKVDPSEAEKEFRAALALDPEHYPAQVFLAEISYAKGEYERGLSEAMIAAALRPTDRAAVDLIEKQINRRIGLLMLGMVVTSITLAGALSSRQAGGPIAGSVVFGGTFIWAMVVEYRKIRSVVGAAALGIVRSALSRHPLSIVGLLLIPVSWLLTAAFSILFIVNPDFDTGTGVALSLIPVVMGVVLWVLGRILPRR